MARLFLLSAVLVVVAACSSVDDLSTEPEPLGRFLLGHNIVVVDDPKVGPLSRKVEDAAWQASLTDAIDARFGRFEGDRFYHIAIKVEGYVLALPGVPFVAAPKSVLFMNVTLWDDAKGTKINQEPKFFTVFEQLSGETIVSSGLTQSKEVQMQNLSRNAARSIQNWMRENAQWFGDVQAAENG